MDSERGIANKQTKSVETSWMFVARSYLTGIACAHITKAGKTQLHSTHMLHGGDRSMQSKLCTQLHRRVWLQATTLRNNWDAGNYDYMIHYLQHSCINADIVSEHSFGTPPSPPSTTAHLGGRCRQAGAAPKQHFMKPCTRTTLATSTCHDSDASGILRQQGSKLYKTCSQLALSTGTLKQVIGPSLAGTQGKGLACSPRLIRIAGTHSQQSLHTACASEAATAWLAVWHRALCHGCSVHLAT